MKGKEEKWTSKWQEGWILYEKDKDRKVVTITVNRPEALNAMTLAMYDKMNEMVRGVDEDDDVKVVVIKGAGRAFSSGFDIGELGFIHGQSATGKERHRPSQRARLIMDGNHFWAHQGLYNTIYRCKKATIAQVHGYCYGGGHEIASTCDITIAAEDTLFTHPGYRYIGPTGWIAYFIELMGVKKTKEMMLTGIPLDAQEALRVGLVNKVVPLDKLDEETNNMVEAILQMPFDGIVMGKAHFEAALDALGVGTGNTLGYILHALQTNIRYEPGEFNLFRERRNKSIKGAITSREAHYKET